MEGHASIVQPSPPQGLIAAAKRLGSEGSAKKSPPGGETFVSINMDGGSYVGTTSVGRDDTSSLPTMGSERSGWRPYSDDPNRAMSDNGSWYGDASVNSISVSRSVINRAKGWLLGGPSNSLSNSSDKRKAVGTALLGFSLGTIVMILFLVIGHDRNGGGLGSPVAMGAGNNTSLNGLDADGNPDVLQVYPSGKGNEDETIAGEVDGIAIPIVPRPESEEDEIPAGLQGDDDGFFPSSSNEGGNNQDTAAELAAALAGEDGSTENASPATENVEQVSTNPDDDSIWEGDDDMIDFHEFATDPNNGHVESGAAEGTIVGGSFGAEANNGGSAGSASVEGSSGQSAAGSAGSVSVEGNSGQAADGGSATSNNGNSGQTAGSDAASNSPGDTAAAAPAVVAAPVNTNPHATVNGGDGAIDMSIPWCGAW